MPTGEIEVLAGNVEVFNTCRMLPFEIKDFVKVSGNPANDVKEYVLIL